MRKNWTRVVSIAAVAALSLSACGADGTGENSGSDSPGSSSLADRAAAIEWLTTADPPASEVANVVEDATLRVRFYDEPSGFDPATIFRVESENIAFNVYSGLTTYDGETGEIIPDLATEWTSTDNTVWTFTLREGVTFQDGYGDFTSADVKYSYERIMDPATGSPYATEFASIVSIDTPDDYTVTITLDEPNANFLHLVSNYHQGQIVSQEAVEEFGDDYAFNPIGTGPFIFSDYVPGTSFTLTRFEDYYDGPAPLETVRYSIIKDDETAAIALQNDEVDLVMRQRGDERIVQLAEDGYRMFFLAQYGISVKMFNAEIEPLADPLVRQAWAHAVDWETINATVSPVSQVVATNILPPWMEVATTDLPTYPYDPERAMELLAEAGYPEGFTVTELGRTSDGIDEASQLEQSYLEAVGITLEFELVDTPVNNQRRNSGDFEIAGRLLPAINPDMILFSYLAPENIAPAGLNGARYDNPELYDLLTQARAESDEATRLDLYAEVQRIAMTDLPYLPSYASNNIWPAQQRVQGVVLNPLAQVDLHDVYLIED